ncbi:MAG: hypothetical protein Q7V17_07690 [Afipia sp.]|nr:hypothetical protein [Afipia sp.]
MRKVLLTIAASILVAGSASAADIAARPYTKAPALSEPEWVLSAEGMAMWRGNFSRSGLVLNNDLPGIIDSSVTEPGNVAGGMRAYLEKNLGGGQSIELGGFFTTEASRSALIISPGQNLFAAYTNDFNPANPNFFNSADAYGARFGYSTQMMGVEANYKMPFYALGPNVKWFGGVRWIRLKDKFSSTFYDEIDDFQGIDNGIDNTSISVTNNLIGAQIGLQGMAPIGGGFSIGGRGSFGLYANMIDRKFSFFSENGTTPLPLNPTNVNTSTTRFAQVVELMPRIEYQVARNWTVFAAGQFMYLNGVGDVLSGFGNFGQVPGGSFNSNASATFYGASGGVKVSFNP